MELLIPLIFSFLTFFGIFFAAFPGIPAVFFMFALSAIFALTNHFSLLSPKELMILGVIYLVSFCVDAFSGVLAAKYGGASLRSMGAGLLGAIIGMVVFPPLGSLLGLFLGILISELVLRRDHVHALKTAAFGVAGVFVGLLVNVLIAITFFGTFISFVFFSN